MGAVKISSIQGDGVPKRKRLPSLGELFAKCEYNPETNSVEPVTDSSRYFVLRIEENGKHAFIGLGFQERTESFDFNVTLQDFVKHIRAEKAAQDPNEVDSGPKMDYSLKAGEQISINIGNIPKRAANKPRSTENVSQLGSAPLPFLPPPPSVSVAKQQMKHHNTGVGIFGATTDQFGRPLTGDGAGKAESASIVARKNGETDWGDFGDFTGGRTNTESKNSSTAQWTSFT